MAADAHDISGETDLPGEVVEDILAERRRRAMLACLADADEPVVVTDLAEEICAMEPGSDPGDAATCREVRDDIYDRHLPKLTATGVLEYDSMRETVEVTDAGVLEALDRER